MSEFLCPWNTLFFINVKGEGENKKNKIKYESGQVRLWYSLSGNCSFENLSLGGMSLIVGSENKM